MDTWEGCEYASSSEYTSVTQSSVENSSSYMFDKFLSIPWALRYARVWIFKGPEYTKVTHGSV